jgi:FkbM family methyltransferase
VPLKLFKYTVQSLIRRAGYDVQKYGPYRDPILRLQYALQRHQVATVLDVGANIGQFGRQIRGAGFQGRIISFEPLSDAYATLVINARQDPLWTVAPRCAVASTCGTTEINIAANSQSSSILKMLDRHIAGDRKSGYVGKETVNIITLDSFLDNETGLADTAIALKIDTQGYEPEVLGGLDKWSDRVKVIQAEMSLTALYDGDVGFIDLYRSITDRGYHCISIEPGFIDPRTFEVLQTNAIFER